MKTPKKAQAFNLVDTPTMADIAERSPQSLVQDRHHGRGLPYLRCGGRVLYDVDQCVEVMREAGRLAAEKAKQKSAA